MVVSYISSVCCGGAFISSIDGSLLVQLILIGI